jgi:pimeloyl-ACP methyl ester carboxylesterase
MEETMTNETGQTRRIVLGGLAASAGLLSMIDETTAQAQTSGKTFVLVHGAWHGGWCWRRVSDLLEKKGHKVFTPTMTGLGERSHLLDAKINLATHVTDIVNVIKWESLNDIVLVGHSYGGAVVSGVAEQVPEAIGCFVFLDAFAPENGESVASLTTRRQAIEELVQKGETFDEAGAGGGVPGERERPRLGRPHVHAASARDLHRQADLDRLAQPRRQEGLHPRCRLCEPAVRRRSRQAQGDRRLARLRGPVRPRRHGRHARPLDGDPARGRVVPPALIA